MDAQWFFLDFDGVICDSLEECYQSSWLAWTKSPVVAGVRPEPAPQDQDLRARFVACRPFVRSGEDYLLLHDLLQRGVVPRTQNEFDQASLRRGRQGLEEWKKDLYRVRDLLLAHHRGLWLSWNPLYPGMEKGLVAVQAHPRVRVLSTKKAEFIHEILKFQGVEWSLDKTIYTGEEKKLDLIRKIVGKERALLIDDQIDHLDFQSSFCDCRLALWGYVQTSWLRPEVPGISLEATLEILHRFSGT